MSDFTNNLRLCFDLITACGISSTCPGHSAETASRWKLWIWFSIALHFSIILVTVHCREFYLRSDLSAVGMLLNIMYYCALGISAGIVILQALLTQNRQNEFLEKMTQLRSLRVKDEEKDNQFSARLAKLFIISFCVIILSNVLFFLMISYDAQWTQYYFASTLPTTINRIVCMKVFIFLEILYRELNSFRECISGFVQNGSGLKDIHIHLLSDWHSEIIDAVAMFKSLFHWSLMVVLWDGYLLLGSNMYWAYLQIMIRKNYWASLILLLISVLLMFCIYLILKGSDKITSEYKRCQRLVFLLEPEIPTLENYQKMDLLAMKFISHNINIHTMRFVYLNVALFFQLLTTIPEYMVIYSQFLT